MPRTIPLSPEIAMQVGYGQVEVDDFVTDKQFLDNLNNHIAQQKAQQVSQQQQTQQPTPQPVQRPLQRQQGLSVGENIARGFIGQGLAPIAELGFRAVGDTDTARLISQYQDAIQPKTELGNESLLRIAQQEGLSEAGIEIARRLPGELASQVPIVATTIATGGLFGSVAKLLGFANTGVRVAQGIGAASTSAIEGLGLAKEIEQKGGSKAQQVTGGIAATTLIGALNTAGLGFALKPLLKTGAVKGVVDTVADKAANTFFGKATHILASGGVEGLTEWMEEPGQIAIMESMGIDGGGIEKLKAALDVVPVAFLSGGLLRGVAQYYEKGPLSAQTRQEIVDGLSNLGNDIDVPAGTPEWTLPKHVKTNLRTSLSGGGTRVDEAVAIATEAVMEKYTRAGAAREGISPDEYYQKNLRSFNFIHEDIDRIPGLKGTLNEYGLHSVGPAPDELGFYLKSAQEIDNAVNLFDKSDTASVQAVSTYLKKRVGKDELDFLGVEELLPAGSPKDRVSKQAVMEFLKEKSFLFKEIALEEENGPQILEKQLNVREKYRDEIYKLGLIFPSIQLPDLVKFHVDYDRTNEFIAKYPAISANINPSAGTHFISVGRDVDGFYAEVDDKKVRSFAGRKIEQVLPPEIIEPISEFYHDIAATNVDTARYTYYTNKSLTNRRELVLKAPFPEFRAHAFEDLVQSSEIQPREVDDTGSTVRGIQKEGIFGWLRVGDFVKDGKRYLYVDEVQSDVGQDPFEYLTGVEDIYARNTTTDPEVIQALKERDAAFEAYKKADVGDTVPVLERKQIYDDLVEKVEALYRKHEILAARGQKTLPVIERYKHILLKRTLYFAAQNDYDGIILSSADEQVQRYSEAQRKGMEHYYGKEYPETLKKLLGQVGVKGEFGNIVIRDKANETKYTTKLIDEQHLKEGVDTRIYIELSPEDRQKILDSGYSLFSKQKGDERVKGQLIGEDKKGGQIVDYQKLRNASRLLIRTYKGADVATVLHEFGHLAAITATGETKKMIEKVFGGRKIENWSLKEHEKWARYWETFFYTGQTDNPELKGPMQVLKAQMRNIHESVRQIMASDSRFDLNANKKEAIRGRKKKLEILDALFAQSEAIDNVIPESMDGLNQIRSLLQLVDEDGEGKNFAQMLVDNKFRINGINMKDFLASMDLETMEKYIAPLLQNLGRTKSAEPINMEEERMKAISLLERNQGDITEIQKKLKGGRQLSAAEIISLNIVQTMTAAAYVKVVMTPGIKKSARRNAFEAFQAIARTKQNAASYYGQSLRMFAALHSLEDVIQQVELLGRQLSKEELLQIMSVDISDPEAMKETIDKIAKNNKPIQTAILSFYYNSLLFNPATLGMNAFSNIMNTIYVGGTKEMAAVIDRFMSKLSGRPRSIYSGDGVQYIRAMGRNLAFQNPDARRQFVEALKGRVEGQAATEFDDKVGSHTLRSIENFFEYYQGKWWSPDPNNRGAKVAAGLMTAGQRTMTAFDVWTKSAVREAYLGNEGIIAGRVEKEFRKLPVNMQTDDQKRITQREVEAFFIYDELFRQQEHSVRKVQTELEKRFRERNQRFPSAQEKITMLLEEAGGRDIPRIAEYRRRSLLTAIAEKEKSLGRKVTKNERAVIESMIDDNTIRVESIIEKYQAAATFQDAPGKLTKNILAFRESIPILGRMFVPFVVTPINIAARATELIPGIGIPVGIRSGIHPAELWAKQMQGAVLFFTIYHLFKNGFLTGPPPDDREEYAAKMGTGWRPYSIRLPDGLYVDYRRFDPFATVVTMATTTASEIDRIEKMRLDDQTKDYAVSDLLTKMAIALRDEFYMSTWIENMLVFSSEEPELKRRAARAVSGLVPFSSLQRSMYRAYLTYEKGGVPVPDRPSFMESFGGGLWMSPPPRLDVFGEQVRSAPNLPHAWIPPDSQLAKAVTGALSFFSPIQVSADTADSVEAELARLELYPTMPGNRLKIPGDSSESELSSDVYNEYVVRAGSMFKDRVKQVIDSPGYLKADDRIKLKIIERHWDNILKFERERARMAEFRARRDNATPSDETYEELIARVKQTIPSL